MVARTRYALQLTVGSAAFVFGLLAAVQPHWIEVVFHVDPDHGNGAVEWAIAAVAIAVGASLFVAALLELAQHALKPEH